MAHLQPAGFSLPSGLSNGSNGSNGVNGSGHEKVLVVGSLATAQGGSYISAVEDIERRNGAGTVEKQLWDRIVAGAASLEPKSFSAAHVVLAAEDFGAFEWEHLFGPIAAALKQGGEVKSVEAPGVEAALRQVGLSAISTSSGQVTARAAAASVSLNLRKGPSKAAKASLWSFSAPPSDDAANLIDDDSLLTAEDLARPARITRPDCDVKRTRKACKNCTCGLRELELEEDDDLPNGIGKEAALDEAVRDNEAKDAVRGAEGGVKKKKIKTGAVTSSCGNCYLGDAFRCSSCPYLGLPAFEPGQKVELTADMGDDL